MLKIEIVVVHFSIFIALNIILGQILMDEKIFFCFINTLSDMNDPGKSSQNKKDSNNENTKKKYSRNYFTKDEDLKLIYLVNKHGSTNWNLIAKKMKGRSSRQCKDRWLNYLSPNINNQPWTQEEEELLVHKYEEIGPLWKQIATYFPSRTDVYLKNKWRLRERHIKKEKLRIAKIIYNERLLKCHGLSHKINKKEVESDDKSPNVEKILPNEQKKELTKPIVRIFSTKIHHLK